MKQYLLTVAVLVMVNLLVRQIEWNVQLSEPPVIKEISPEEMTSAEGESPERVVLDSVQRLRLDQFMNRQEGSWSVYLHDLDSGEIYSYNEDACYYPASLLKMPYAFWLARKADRGELSFSQKILNGKYGMLGEGPLERYNLSQEIPVFSVIKAMIAHSDNDAVSLLAHNWPGTPDSGFRDFIEGLQFTYPEGIQVDAWGVLQGMVTVTDMGHTLEALHDYFAGDAPNVYDLKRCFLAADHQILYVPENVMVAKKYGSWQYAYHDAVIVYGEHPYLLCVMSDRGLVEENFPEEPTRTMQELGQMIYEMLNP